MVVDTFSKHISENEVQLIDVRTHEVYADGHIEDATNLNVYDKNFIEETMKSLDSSKPVAVYCRSGKRSADAAQKLSEKGIKVINLKVGILAWKANNLPIY